MEEKINLVFINIELKKDIPSKFLNSSAPKIKVKKKVKYFKKYFKSIEVESLNENMISAIIIPDKDIIKSSKNLKPAFIIFSNFEKDLKWNRSIKICS